MHPAVFDLESARGRTPRPPRPDAAETATAPDVADIHAKTKQPPHRRKSNRVTAKATTSFTRMATIRGIVTGNRISVGVRMHGARGTGRCENGHRNQTHRPNIPIKRASLGRPKSHRSLQRKLRQGRRQPYQELPKKTIRGSQYRCRKIPKYPPSLPVENCQFLRKILGQEKEESSRGPDAESQGDESATVQETCQMVHTQTRSAAMGGGQ